MSLKADVSAAFRSNIFDRLHKPGSWKILVLDNRATHVLNSVYRMQDLTDMGITLVESIYRARKSFNMEAIYIMCPNRNEVNLLIQDLTSKPQIYQVTHLFFLLPCRKDVMETLISSNCLSRLKTMVQLDLDFIPLESSVFTLDCPETGQLYPLPLHLLSDKPQRLELLAEQLATVCVTLQEFPQICYRKTENNLELARLTQAKLNACRESNPSLGQGLHKDRSVLLLLDRGFDPITPLLHELTLQAMCYDLLTVVDNIYTYGNNKKANLLDVDPLFKELRHQHIADVTKTLPKRVREFAASKKQFAAVSAKGTSGTESGDGGYVNDGANFSDSPRTEGMGLRDLSNLIKRMPEYQSEAASYSAAYSLTETCMGIFRQGIDKLCGAEQDLVMGQTAEGVPTRDPMRTISELFKYDFAQDEDRLRLILLFVLIKDGIAETHLDKLMETAGVTAMNKIIFASLSLILGAQLIQPKSTLASDVFNRDLSSISFDQFEWYNRMPSVTAVVEKVKRFMVGKSGRKDRVDSNSYAFSRWTPYLMDLLEDIISGTLRNSSEYAFLPIGEGSNSGVPGAASLKQQSTTSGLSARFQATPGSMPPSGANPRSTPSNFGADRSSKSESCGPRIIVCIVGGVAWSEARVAYQVTQKCVDSRLAESDRHTGGKLSPRSSTAPNILNGGGGFGWNWEVLIGGTHMISPNSFISDLERMSCYFLSDVGGGSFSAAANTDKQRKASNRP